MTQRLSIETLSPSERAHLAWQYNADEQAQLAQNTGNYAPLSSAIPWQQAHSLPVNVPAQMSWLTDVPGVTVIGQQQIVHPESRPTYRGRVSGSVRTLISIFDRWQLDSGDAAL